MRPSAVCRCAATRACGTYKRISIRSAISSRRNAPVLVEVDRDYDDVLPSVNFVLEVTDEFLIRLGYSEVITRPGLGNLTPGGTVSVSGNNRTVTSGNPYLDPFKADAIDTAFEWYFNDESLLGLALFYKDISTFPQSVSETRPFTGNSAGLPDSVAIAACGTVAGCTPGCRLGVHAAVQQRWRRSRGLRDLVSTGFRERHRRDAELHARDVGDRLHRPGVADRHQHARSDWAVAATLTTLPSTTRPSASACAHRRRIATRF